MTALAAGQSLLLNQRLWTLRQVRPLAGRRLELDMIGASAAAEGMTRRLPALRYGDELFIGQRRGGYWRAHLRHDWLAGDLGPLLNCQPATPLDLLDAHTRHPPLGDLNNEFSWSYSRAAKYETCPRAYYYHYYAAWEGWQPDAPAPVQQAYLLKNLTNIPQWVGTLVHEAIKFALARLKAGQPVAVDDLLRQMRQRARTDFETSRSGRYRQQPNQLTGFQEHYYRENVAASAWQAAWDRAERSLRTFCESAVYRHLAGQPAGSFLNIEELQSFAIAGVKVWVQLDLARRENGVIYLYDWKTGDIDEAAAARQLGIYGLFVRAARPDWAAEPLQGVVFNVAANQIRRLPLDADALANAQTYAERSLTHLQRLLAEPATNRASLERFPMITDLSVCRRCQFRALCGRE